ncbi:MAG: hypothetical protein IKR85_03580 [Clostridia bacterium]|nr:hypothetical protein [Clostridia bacterium]
MKKLLCIALMLALLCTPVSAETVSDALARVTLSVVNMLEISDDYAEFEGQYEDGHWYLNWTGDERYVNAVCGEDGTLFSYWSYDSDDYDYETGAAFGAFPKLDEEKLLNCAGAFMDKTTAEEDWGYELYPVKLSLSRYSNNVSVSGRLTYRSKPTDISFYLQINQSNGRVVSYNRLDEYRRYAPSAAEETVLVSSEEAEALLADCYAMKLVYFVTDAKDMARLVYKRADGTDKAVRASDGALVDRYADGIFAEESMASAKGMDDSGDAEYGRQLSEAELKGAAKYEGALSGAELDVLARGISEIKLTEDYVNTGITYYLSQDKPQAVLSYEKRLEDDAVLYRTLVMDAQSGAPVRLSGYYSDLSVKAGDDTDVSAARAAADAFAEKYLPYIYSHMEYSSGSVIDGRKSASPYARFAYIRMQDGYAFEANSLSITVDTEDASVWAFDYAWDGGQEFYYPEPDKFIGEDAARAAWLKGSELKLMYISQRNGDGKYELTLCYAYDGTDSVYAIDAINGKRYGEINAQAGTYEYADGDGMLYEGEIRLLGEYGIGLKDCRFTADEYLTPVQLMHLVMQAAGNEGGESIEEEQLNRMFRQLYKTLPQADESGCLTRGELVRVMTCVAGYANAAALDGIYSLNVPDWQEVPDELKGACAIAYALGIIDADEEGNLAPGAYATTAAAAHAVYVLLNTRSK